MRTGAPIYTTPGILTETGFELEELSDDTSGSSADDDDDDNGEVRARDEEPSPVTPTRTPKLENYTLEELRRTLQSLIDREEYEEAARVAEIIRRKEDGKI